VTSILDRLFAESPGLGLLAVFWVGMVTSLGPSVALRIPVVTGCVAAIGSSRKKCIKVVILFALGTILAYCLLGTTAVLGGLAIEDLLRFSKPISWLFGGVLLVVGLWVSGFAGSSCHHDAQEHETTKLGKAVVGVLLLGLACGLPLIPTDSRTGMGFLVLARDLAGQGYLWLALLAFLCYGLGQSVPILAVGVLTSLVKAPLMRRVRTQMCSIQQRVQLLGGSGLIVLGVYLIIVG
jgi:cytochrome c biogenesis protein CcdA